MWPRSNKKDEENFAYTSPEKQKKSAARILVIEIICLIIACVIITLLLQYAGIISISGILKNILPSATPGTSTSIKNLPLANEIERSTKKAEILLHNIFEGRHEEVGDTTLGFSVISDNLSYRLSINDKKKVTDLLKEWKVYGHKQDGQNAITNVKVHFTDIEQKGNIVRSIGIGVYLSSIISVNKNQMDVYVQVAPVILNDKTKDPSKYFQTEFISTLYRFSFPAYSPQEVKTQDENLLVAQKKLFAEKELLFKLEKL